MTNKRSTDKRNHQLFAAPHRMEQLPLEVWLRIFRYLQTTDILYSFSDLNNHIQQIILSYQRDIDLSNVSFESCQRFVQHILPVCAPSIRTLTLKNDYQIEFCMKNDLFRSLVNLQRLKIRADRGNKAMLFFGFFAEHFKYLNELVELDLVNVFIYMNDFASLVPPSLTHVSFVCANQTLAMMNVKRLRNIRVLKGYIGDPSELRVIKSLTNLRELYIRVLDINNSDHARNSKFSIPDSLVKLHLEYWETNEKRHSSFKALKTLLALFRNHLRSLTLIIESNANEYANATELQTLSDAFPRLILFQYLIHTSQCPSTGFDHVKRLPNETHLIYTMKPRRPISYFELFRYDLSERLCGLNRPLETLYFARELNSENLKTLFPSGQMTMHYRLPYLRQFFYDISAPTESNTVRDNLVLRLLAFVPNLNFIHIAAESPEEILYFLKRLSNARKDIDHCQCRCSVPLNSAFFFALSRYLPCLKYLYLHGGFFDKRSYIDQFQVPKSVIDGIRKYLTKIILIEFSISVYDRHTSETTDEYKNAILWLDQHSDKLFYADHVVDNSKFETHRIDIWL